MLLRFHLEPPFHEMLQRSSMLLANTSLGEWRTGRNFAFVCIGKSAHHWRSELSQWRDDLFRSSRILAANVPKWQGGRAALNRRWNKTAKHARLCTGILCVGWPVDEMRRNGQTGFRWRIDIRNFRWGRHVSNTRLSQGCSSSFDSNGTGFGCWICVYRISSAFLGKGSQHRRMLIPQFPSLSPGSLRHSSWWSTWSDSLDLHGPRLKWRGIPSLYTRHTVHTFNWSSLARIRWHLSLLRCHPSDKLLLSAVTVQQTADSRAVCTDRSFCLLLSVDAPRMDEDGRMMHTISSCECCLRGISDGVSEVTQETFLTLVSKFGDGLFLSSCHPRHVITFEELSCRFNNFSRKCSRPSCCSGCALIFSWVNPTACLRRRWKRYFLTIPPTMDRDISRFVLREDFSTFSLKSATRAWWKVRVRLSSEDAEKFRSSVLVLVRGVSGPARPAVLNLCARFLYFSAFLSVSLIFVFNCAIFL